MAAGLAVVEGMRLPVIYGMTGGGRFYSSAGHYGVNSIYILVGPSSSPSPSPSPSPSSGPAPVAIAADHLAACVARSAAFAALGATVHLGLDDDAFQALQGRPIPEGIVLLACAGSLRDCGVAAGTVLAAAVDRNMRVVGLIQQDAADTVADACLAMLNALGTEPPRLIETPAPVLMLPGLVPQAVCRHLIEAFEGAPFYDSGMTSMDATGATRHIVDHSRKKRLDWLVEGELGDALRLHLLQRCAPEIEKAFQCQLRHMDRIIVARYDADGGVFQRHRDNVAPTVAFREFALSLNLNADEYQGGDLKFPEYNDHRYSPRTGAGLLFSASVLHEVTPISAGRRYVLLSFLHGDAAETRRLAQAHRQEAPQEAETLQR